MDIQSNSFSTPNSMENSWSINYNIVFILEDMHSVPLSTTFLYKK